MNIPHRNAIILKEKRNINSFWANSVDVKLVIFSYFSQKTGFDISCKLSPLGDNLHELSNSVFWEKQEKIFQYVVCWKFYTEC